MAKHPKISVITVVYNDALHMEHTMLSVLDQTYKDVEYIVIDGGSKDGTAEIIAKYSDRLAYAVSEKDNGISDAMNKGVSHATGDYVFFLNSGDYLLSKTVFADFFARVDSDADILYGGFIGNFSGTAVECTPHSVERVTKKAWQGMQVCHSTLFVRRHLFDAYPFSISRKVSLDVEFMARCVAGGASFERIDMPLFRVGFQGNSADHWLRGRIENWGICRTYFSGIHTDFYHAQGLVREVAFRSCKWLLLRLRVYPFLQRLYHKHARKYVPLLPKNVRLFHE